MQPIYTDESIWQYRGRGLAVLGVRRGVWVKVAEGIGERFESIG